MILKVNGTTYECDKATKTNDTVNIYDANDNYIAGFNTNSNVTELTNDDGSPAEYGTVLTIKERVVLTETKVVTIEETIDTLFGGVA